MKLRSGQPFWLLKNGILAAYPALKRDERCEVAVVGGGITGALMAHQLADAGVDVIVLECGDVAAASTAASTGLLQYEVDVELPELIARVGAAKAVRSLQLGLEAVEQIRRLTMDIADTCGYVQRESWYVARRRWDVPRMKRLYRSLREHGFEVEFLDRKAIANRSTLRNPAAILSHGDAEIDPVRFTHRLLAHAAVHGARVYERTEMVRFDASGRRMSLHTAGGAKVTADRIVFATGYESERYIGRKIGRLHSTYAMVSEPLTHFHGWPARALIWESARPYHYLRTTPDDRAMIGGGDVPFKNAKLRDARLGAKARMLEQYIRGSLPEIEFEPAYAWCGTFGESEDGLPYIGACDRCPNAYFALGYGGNGITFSMIAARLITATHTGRGDPDAGLFSFER